MLTLVVGWWCTVFQCVVCCFFFQAEDGIRELAVTGVQTCALPILLWNVSVPKFETVGCFAGCHAGEGTGKPYGNKYFSDAGALADLWHWKSIRNLNQVDDQYVDSQVYDKEKFPEAGRHSDPNDGGGYQDNQTEDKKLPAFALPDNKPAPPYFILDGEKVPFDAKQYKPGDEVPGI